jgi:hypothetical protein
MENSNGIFSCELSPMVATLFDILGNKLTVATTGKQDYVAVYMSSVA